MNDPLISDPQLQHMEARLAAATPHLSHLEQQQLLYHCAFAAGRQACARKLRRWQTITAALLVFSVGMSVPMVRGRSMPVAQNPESSTPNSTMPRQTPGQPEARFPERQLARVELDAWQLASPVSGRMEGQRIPAELSDPHIRSLTVGSLTRGFFEPSSH
jgi:hypothetical protein